MAELGRYKLGPDGPYYDPQDEGPDQASPEQIAALQMPGGNTGINGGAIGSGTQVQPAPSDSIGYTHDWRGINDPRLGGGADTTVNPAGTPWGSQPGSTNTGINGAQTGGVQQPAAPAPTTAPVYQQMEGVDVNKLNDPTHTTPKYVASRILASGGSIEQAAQAIGATVLDATRMRLPSGEVIDIRRDEEGANALQWLVMGGGDAGGGESGGASGSGIGGQVSPLASGGAPTSGAPGGSNFSDQVRQLLMQQLGGLTGPLTGDDPQIKGEMDAQEAVLERNRRQRRSADAERAAMNGLLNGGQSSGSFEQNIASGFEDKGQALTGIQAQLFTRELQSRRSHVAQLLNMAMASGDAESARNLQYQLALLDEAYRRSALAQNQGQWNDSFGLDAARFRYGQDRDLATYASGY